jgi:hypothetical protein
LNNNLKNIKTNNNIENNETNESTNNEEIKKKVYIICSSEEDPEETTKYLNDIIVYYKSVEFIKIKNKKKLFSITNYLPYDILFVQQLLYLDILPQDLIEIKNKYNIKIIISIHNFCWFISDENINNPTNKKINHNGYLKSIKHINTSIIYIIQNLI